MILCVIIYFEQRFSKWGCNVLKQLLGSLSLSLLPPPCLLFSPSIHFFFYVYHIPSPPPQSTANYWGIWFCCSILYLYPGLEVHDFRSFKRDTRYHFEDLWSENSTRRLCHSSQHIYFPPCSALCLLLLTEPPLRVSEGSPAAFSESF